MKIWKGNMFHKVVGELTQDEIDQFVACGYEVEE